MRTLGLLATDHRRWLALVAMLLLLVGGALGLPPRVDTTAAALLPADEPHSMALTAMSEDLGGTGTITLVFDGQGDLDPLAQAIHALPEVAYAVSELPEPALRHIALMQLDAHDVSIVADRIDGALQLGSALNPILAGQILNAEDLRTRLTPTPPPTLVPEDGWSRVMVLPHTSAFDASAAEQLVATLRHMVAENTPDDMQLVYMGGTYVTIADSSASVRQDLAMTSGMSAVLVLLVLAIGLRSLRAPLVLFPPLIVANVLNLAWLQWAFGAINTFTSLGTAVLIGLGIDFGVHLLARYREARATGDGQRDAIGTAWASAGPPCATAALTSAAGFSAAWIGEFRGISELGAALATGLLLSLVCMLVLLPGLITWFDRSDRPLLGATHSADTGSPWRAPPGLFTGLVLLTVALAAFAATRLTFEYDFTRSGPVDRQFEALSAAQQQLMVQSLPPVAFTLDDAEQADAFAHELIRKRTAGDLPHAGEVLWAGAWLPPDQDQRVAALARVKAQLEHPSARHLPGPLLHAMAPLRAWDGQTHDLHSLSPMLDDVMLSGRRVLLVPTGDLHDMRETAALVREIDSLGPTGASVHVLQGVIYPMVLRDAPKIVGLALLLVFGLVALDLRRALPIALAVFSLMAGLTWALAAVAALGIRISLGNLIGLPILLGIGVDLVIHLAHRLNTDGLRVAYRTVGVAAVLSTLTTIASFAALNVASSGAIRTLGQLVAVGLGILTPVSAAVLALGWLTVRPRD